MMRESSDTGDKILSEAAITQLRELGDGDDLLIEIIGLFNDETPKRLDAMASAVASGNCEELSRISHSLKSSSANIGAVKLYAVCIEIESTSRGGSMDGMAKAVATARIEYQSATDALEDLVR
jgi:HPt (histidine-containing phosphotransfer) domain-containing protein